MTTVMGLTDEQVTEYKEQGWVVLPSVFSREELSVLERTSEEVLKRPGPEVERGGRLTSCMLGDASL